jgi:hypothetical protein
MASSKPAPVVFHRASGGFHKHLHRKVGISWKYSEVAFGTAIVLWALLSGFRPEWRRARYWLVLAAVVGVHLWGWLYLARRIDRFGFALMFLLVVVELAIGASLISKLIPEDEEGMLDYINRW